MNERTRRCNFKLQTEQNSCYPRTRPELEKIRHAHQEEQMLTERIVFYRGTYSLKIENSCLVISKSLVPPKLRNIS